MVLRGRPGLRLGLHPGADAICTVPAGPLPGACPRLQRVECRRHGSSLQCAEGCWLHSWHSSLLLKVSVTQSCLTLCNPMDCSPSDSSVHRDSPGRNTGVGCHALLQGIFSTQGSNPNKFPALQADFLRASHQGYESSIRKEDCSRRQETWKLFLVFVISWSMRLVKFFKGPRPQCSHLSHGQIRLGDL